jgi:hypothetical protein
MTGRPASAASSGAGNDLPQVWTAGPDFVGCGNVSGVRL